LHERERDACGVVDEAKAVWAHNRHSGFVRQLGDLTLLIPTSFSALSEARGKDNSAAHLLSRQPTKRGEYAGFGNSQNRRIDAVWQIFHRRDACAPPQSPRALD
jgi:hypothetical protein